MLIAMLDRSNKISYYNGQKYNSLSSNLYDVGKMHGVKRVIIFCIMTAVLPTILIITPLYLRHHIFATVTYPVAESDVLAIREGVSSIFCDSLNLKMNSTFNAFQLKGEPKISSKRKHIRLKKSMILPDDTLEYWGFYLLKGALVKLKVCSRYDGSRILVVRGGKNLNTCGLMNHNFKKYGAKLDAEHSRVKVTYEKHAEVVGLIDLDHEFNVGREVDDVAQNRLELDAIKNKLTEVNIVKNMTHRMELEKDNSTQIRHRKRFIRKWQQKLDELKKVLEEEDQRQEERAKRSISPLDAHIKHGGNALNFSMVSVAESDSVSSFETDMLTCYDGKILLTRGFLPSHLCTNVDYLDQSNHMVTEHLVASDGYYYYIFYSDNDFVKNDVHAVFDIYKPTYRFANSSSKECINQTECEFPIQFFSDETVIVEVPTKDGIEHEEDISLLISSCKPRMGVYIIFPILVLFLILVCAFL